MFIAWLAAGACPLRLSGEEVRAATRPPANRGAPDPGGFLGALSFTSGREPINVTADSLEFDYRSRVLSYKGGIVATQDDLKLESDTLTLKLDEKGQAQLKEVVASGKVRLSKGSRWATAGRAAW